MADALRNIQTIGSTTCCSAPRWLGGLSTPKSPRGARLGEDWEKTSDHAPVWVDLGRRREAKRAKRRDARA
jgi:hypothetical protein